MCACACACACACVFMRARVYILSLKASSDTLAKPKLGVNIEWQGRQHSKRCWKGVYRRCSPCWYTPESHHKECPAPVRNAGSGPPPPHRSVVAALVSGKRGSSTGRTLTPS
jgi:hypothetical protein